MVEHLVVQGVGEIVHLPQQLPLHERPVQLDFLEDVVGLLADPQRRTASLFKFSAALVAEEPGGCGLFDPIVLEQLTPRALPSPDQPPL